MIILHVIKGGETGLNLNSCEQEPSFILLESNESSLFEPGVKLVYELLLYKQQLLLQPEM